MQNYQGRGKCYLITLTETLISPHITKTEFNNCFIIHFKKHSIWQDYKNTCFTVSLARFYVCFPFHHIPHAVIFCIVGSTCR